MPQEILEYIRECQELDFPETVINQELQKAGWSEEEIKAAWLELKSPVQETTLSPNLNSGSGLKKFLKYIIAVAVAVLLAGSGYFAYGKLSFFQNPPKAWERAVRNFESLQSWHQTTEITYSDTLPAERPQIEAVAVFETDIQTANAAQKNISVKSQISFKIEGFSFSLEIAFRKIGDNIYYNAGKMPFLDLMLSPTDSGKTEWIKFSQNRQKEFIQKQTPQIADSFEKLQNLIKNTEALKLITLKKRLNEDQTNAPSLFRYEGEINQETFRSLLQETINIYSKIFGSQDLESFLNKFEVKKLEVAIGKKNKRIHEIIVEISAPSFGKLADKATQEAQTKSRDARRLADIRQIQTALELFFKDHNRYPQAINGLPDSLDGKAGFLLSSHLPVIPKAPKPADGSCTTQENYYWYEQIKNGKSYRLTFCLGSATPDFEAGVIELGPAGSKMISVRKNASEEISLSAIPLNAKFLIKTKFSKFNEPVTIEEPKDAVDYFERPEPPKNPEPEASPSQ